MTQLFCASYACLVCVTVTDVYRHFQQCLSYRGGQLYFYRKPEYREKTSDPPQIGDIHFIIQCCIGNTSSKLIPTHTITAYQSIHYAITDHHCHCGRCFDKINFQGRCQFNYHMIMATTPPVLICIDCKGYASSTITATTSPSPAVFLDNVCF